ncbi:MAG: leucyl/phenylalanyl-tRNA--protein transferase, partial [Bacteroidia bacterium]
QFHLSKNMRRLYRKTTWRMTHNTSFEQVIRACSNRETTWISEEIIEAYVSLHKQGHARSVEVWEGDELVGGLYGIEMKRAFFGESMFSTRTNASKLALVHLVEFLMTHSFILLDTQYLNDHIAQFGGVEIPDENYMALLGEALSN